MNNHTIHQDHQHTHGEGCGHVAIPHGDHIDYLHDGHLHHKHEDHWDECGHTDCSAEHEIHQDHEHTHGEGCGHVAIPHGDHIDYLHDGHLHHKHEDHWDECTDNCA
ncbi:hypothetical protein [Corynebacterium gerontici]|uniref:hypothetical protein n=1 Tax=Corynebacterium gerontici TaxID=2079234 RepID=UPI000F4D5161|nr:hypothetical protein [Corynebacterium gerontici]